ncbi:hypothetical protein C9374_008407 [Naegleria lovaniensis]|uniref:Uncharacterized protein n=1 Tax=Naegleria lovaniensis TaxID=51637 RepID=A0AA88GF73_NAELO|nr:uncharacterized protein C9374_008407 [Naegleria lovaniensis]KAG2378264.1 hypothetical protein C9374_008407 [Naegleria lovaniensis]
MIPQVALYFLFIGTWFIQLLTLIILSIFKTLNFSSYPFLIVVLYSISSLCYDLAFILTKPIPMNISFLNRTLDKIMVRQGHYELFIYMTSTIITAICDYYIYYHVMMDRESERIHSDDSNKLTNFSSSLREQEHLNSNVHLSSRNCRFQILTFIRLLLMSSFALVVNIYGCYLLFNTAYKNSIFIRILPLPHVILHILFYGMKMMNYCRTSLSSTREVDQSHHHPMKKLN